MTQLCLYLFGPPRVELAGEPVHIPRRKALALLAYLAVTGQSHSRDWLATLLWPERDQSGARERLRRILSEIKSALGEGWLESDRENAQLIDNDDLSSKKSFWLDVRTFQEKLAGCESHNRLTSLTCPACVAGLEAAVELYTEDFMAGFSLKDCRTYDEWQFFQAEELRGQLANALVRLSAHYASSNDDESAIGYARRWLALDPLHEPAHRQLMVLYDQSGQHAAALQQYQICQHTLQDELGVEPSEETKELYQRIKNRSKVASSDIITFGAWLKRRRHQLDLTQQALAKRVSCSVGTIRKMEADERRPSRQLAGLLAHQLEIPDDQHEAFISFARSEPYLTDVSFPVLPPEDDQIPVIPQDPQENPIRHNLPAQPTPFIGRESELAELETLISDPDIRLVTIVGPGGMGKTRLALAAAEGHLGSEQFRDGIYFVDLAALNDPGLIVSATIVALGLRLQGADDAAVQALLLETLEQKKMLLLFDNCEHLLAGMDLAADIFHGAAGVQILATSRERLHLRMEQVYPIEGLEFPDWETPEDAAKYTAVRLFLQSAQRSQPDFSLRDGEDLTYLARICRLVAGMPLALELAASWVDMLPLTKIAAGLQEGLDLLETEMRDMPERHRSVRAAIDHSWKQLGEKERSVFSKLSVFRGGLTRDAAREVGGANLRELGRLVNKSFLKYDIGLDRYQVHELMRQYGAEKLVDPESVRTGHLNFFVMFAGQADAGFNGPEPEKWVGPRNAEIDNVRAALDWAVESGQAQNGLKLGVAYASYWLSHDFREGRWRLEQLLALPQAAEATQGRAVALGWAGYLASQLGDFESGLGLCEESISVSREMGELGKLSLGWALIDKGLQLRYRDVAAALQAVEEGIAILRQTGEPWQLCWGLSVRGWLAYMQGNSAQASAFTNESLALARKNNYKWESSRSMHFLGMQLYNQGDYDSARPYLEEALLIRNSAGHTWDQHQLLGAIALLQGDLLQAVAYFEGALVNHRQLGSKMQIARSMSDMGIAVGHVGDHSRAADLIHEALLLNQEVTSEHEIGICLLSAAGVQKSPSSGALLLGASWAALEAAGEIIQPIYQAEIKRVENAARAALGESDFEAAYAEGKDMPMDQAIAMALADSDDWIDGKITSFDWGSALNAEASGRYHDGKVSV